jgi:hypothetical protein
MIRTTNHKPTDTGRLTVENKSASEHIDLLIPLLCVAPQPEHGAEYIPSTLIRNRVFLLSHLMGFLHRFDEDEKMFSNPKLPMSRWISGYTGGTMSEETHWHKNDCIGGRTITYELPQLAYFLVNHYMF